MTALVHKPLTRRTFLAGAAAAGGVVALTGSWRRALGREGVGEPAAVATEFVGGAITSQGIADQYAGEGGAPVVAFPADAVVKANNPHIKFSNQQSKGYGVLEARAGELLVQYKSPRTVLQPRAASFTSGRFRVARGTPAVEVLA